jgi:two-component system, OmpR family, phosphate regulon sensor histidine kinase PhoR
MDAGRPVVLIVDDEPVVRRGCARILEGEGCRVALAEDGASCLARLADTPVRVVLLDLIVPDMDGPQLLARVRAAAPTACMVVMTGSATVENAVRSMKEGAFDFLAKPFLPDELRAVVRRALGSAPGEVAAAAGGMVPEAVRCDGAPGNLLGALPLAAVVVDAARRVVSANGRARQLAGIEDEGWATRPFGEFVRSPAAEEALVRAMEAGAGGEFEYVTEGDDPRAVVARWAPLGADGTAAGVVVVLEDVTLARKVERARTEFVGTVVHELRSPLSTVQQLVYFLRDGEAGPISDTQRDLLTRVQVRIAELLDMVKNLLSLAKLEAGTLVYRLEPVPLAPLLAECVEAFATAAETRRIALSLKTDPATPAVMGDRENLKTALRNLIGNAIKYTEEGGSVAVTAGFDEDEVHVAVKDTGIGIPPEALPRIFDKFYRVDNEKTRWITGSGLGLALTKQIVEKQGGRIEVKSEVGAGSTFRVSFPL